MGAIPRFKLVGKDTTNHCTWQALDHARVFDRDGARELFLELLDRYKKKYGVLIHSYCIMGTHPHVVCKCTTTQEDFSAFWRDVNSVFGRWCNKQIERKGQVVKDRMKSGQVQTGESILRVMRYGDLNPVRAGLVRCAKDWKFSSHRHFAYGEPNPLIDDPPEYLALGRNGPERRKAYQAFFARKASEEFRQTRKDLVTHPFIGEESWVEERRGKKKKRRKKQPPKPPPS